MTHVPSIRVLILAVVCITCALALRVQAASFHSVSDLIVDSAPNASTTHMIQFTTEQAIPASGHIVITPQAGAFTIPAGFDYTDLDVSVSSGGPYVDRDLSFSADGVNDGVAVTTGSVGSITITLNSTTGISAGQQIRIKIGTSAVVGAIGSHNISNPASINSYKIRMTSSTSANTPIDIGTAMIAVVAPVSATLQQIPVAPVLSNGLPSGLLAAGNTTIELSFNSDRPATCRYSTSPNVLYANMTETINTISPFFYTKVISGHQNDTTYNYYIRCLSDSGTANDTDFIISFTLDVDPISNSSIVPTSEYLGRGGSGEYPNGSSVLYTASVTMEGWALPLSKVTLLRDGKVAVTTTAQADGSFSGTISGIERGTYTFQSYFEDSQGTRSGSYVQTISLQSGSRNTLSNIVIPPTIRLSSNSIEVGDPVTVSGESLLNGKIEVSVQKQGTGASPTSVQTFTSSTTPQGVWQIVIPGTKFQKGSYVIRARAILNPQARSEFGKLAFLGVGQEPSPDLFSRADINRDGKVNLIDFSILLSHWKSADADADINEDGDVNLADFSILLFNWTG